ncbi:MAG TPA: hypothetical protein VEI97_17655 [bacterium]|nr:hypothetical protein [bacterium]
MASPIQDLVRKLTRAGRREALRVQLHAEVHRLRTERRDLLSRIGEAVTVWHRAGRNAEELLTSGLQGDLELLGRIEQQLHDCLRQLELVETGLPAEALQPSGTYLEEVDLEPIVVKAAPRPEVPTLPPAPEST